VAFDGLTAYLKSPGIANIEGVSMWLYLDSNQQHTGAKYLLDARYGVLNGYYSSSAVGGLWANGKQFVDGVETFVEWAALPTDRCARILTTSAYKCSQVFFKITTIFPARMFTCA
jgi:hypothetical protein